jgi:sterol 24-C-methyltransferase
MESLRRAEYFLSTRLGLKTGQTAVDVGCGVGGPMRNIARFSGANIVGINNNEYQIKVGTKYNQQLGLDKQCSFIKSDFMSMPVKDNTYEAAYAIEATCHSPNKTKCFGEVLRVVKPGGYFACYEWVVLDTYDKSNKKQVALKEGIEVGNGLPELATIAEVVAALKNSGWEVIEHFDANRNAHKIDNVPWYQPLAGEYSSIGGFRKTPVGRFFTHIFVSVLETLHIAPKGSIKVSAILNATADDLAESGKLEIFTPSYYFLARKPLTA